MFIKDVEYFKVTNSVDTKEWSWQMVLIKVPDLICHGKSVGSEHKELKVKKIQAHFALDIIKTFLWKNIFDFFS